MVEKTTGVSPRPVEGTVMQRFLEKNMNYRKLSDEITNVVIEALQHFDHLDQKSQPPTFEEAQASISGAVDRYRNDPVFRAKVQMLVSRITSVVQDNELHNAALTRRP